MARYRGEVRPAVRRGSIREFFAGDPALKGCWSLDGHARDESSNANHGTLVNTPIEYLGKFGTSYKFNGTFGAGANYIQMPLGASVKGQTLASILCWYYPLANPVSGNSSIYYESTNNGGYGRWALYHLTTGEFSGQMRDTNTGSSFFISETAPKWLNRWNLLGLTVNTVTDALILYRNGLQVAINTATKGAFTSDDPSSLPAIGAFYNVALVSNQSVNGMVDKSGLFFRDLSPSEISQYYQWAIAMPRKYWFYSPEVAAIFKYRYGIISGGGKSVGIRSGGKM